MDFQAQTAFKHGCPGLPSWTTPHLEAYDAPQTLCQLGREAPLPIPLPLWSFVILISWHVWVRLSCIT